MESFLYRGLLNKHIYLLLYYLEFAAICWLAEVVAIELSDFVESHIDWLLDVHVFDGQSPFLRLYSSSVVMRWVYS